MNKHGIKCLPLQLLHFLILLPAWMRADQAYSYESGYAMEKFQLIFYFY